MDYKSLTQKLAETLALPNDIFDIAPDGQDTTSDNRPHPFLSGNTIEPKKKHDIVIGYHYGRDTEAGIECTCLHIEETMKKSFLLTLNVILSELGGKQITEIPERKSFELEDAGLVFLYGTQMKDYFQLDISKRITDRN
jgi:hypothetical protein